LALIGEKLKQALDERGQIIGITGEAGMGKSRLVAEAINLANENQLAGYGGECHSYGTNTSYLVWQNIWRSFFEIDLSSSLDDQIRAIENQLNTIDPNLAMRLPLLGAVLNLPIPDNQLTASFDARVRKASLEALLVNCLRIRAKEIPIMLVLDDCQWIDPLSYDLLEVVGRSIQGMRVFLLMAYRPPLMGNVASPAVSKLSYFSQINLAEFTPAEARQLIGLKVAQLFNIPGEIGEDLVDLIYSRSEGNPFYIEELLNFVRDQSPQLYDIHTLADLDLPTSLQSLILSRIDQLTESQKITLKVASVIGRLFNAAMLWGAYPQIGDSQSVIADLEQLIRLDLMAMDAPQPEQVYFFKHILTQEVTYESLPFATRAMLHDQIGRHIEHAYSQSLDQYVDLLAFHYDRSQNETKRREYLYRAGEHAQYNYANTAAIDYYQRLLPLVPQEEKVGILLKLGKVYEVVGKWPQAGERYQQSLELAEEMQDRQAWGWARAAQAELLRKQGMYKEAVTRLLQAQDAFEDVGDRAGVAQAFHYAGTVAAQQGDYEAAKRLYEQSLEFRRELNDRPQIAHLLNNLGILRRFNGDSTGARELYEESLTIRRELGDKKWIAQSLNNIGNVALDQKNLAEARSYLEEALVMLRQVGDPWEIANGLNNLGNVVRAQGDYQTARMLYAESLEIYQQYGDKRALAYLFEDMSCLAALEGQAERTLRLLGSAASLREAIGSPLSRGEREKIGLIIGPALQHLEQSDQDALTSEGKMLELEQAIRYALTGVLD
jgi:predicted ATPase